MSVTEQRPNRVLRRLLRTPITLYRANMGWLFGHRLVYLVHRGRVTGEPREVVVEVVSYGAEDGEVVVVSGWGEKAHWYRNIKAAAPMELRIGKQRYLNPRVRFLDDEETRRLLDDYVRRHRFGARFVARFTGWPLLDPQGRAGLAERLPAVAFTPR